MLRPPLPVTMVGILRRSAPFVYITRIRVTVKRLSSCAAVLTSRCSTFRLRITRFSRRPPADPTPPASFSAPAPVPAHRSTCPRGPKGVLAAIVPARPQSRPPPSAESAIHTPDLRWAAAYPDPDTSMPGRVLQCPDSGSLMDRPLVGLNSTLSGLLSAFSTTQSKNVRRRSVYTSPSKKSST